MPADSPASLAPERTLSLRTLCAGAALGLLCAAAAALAGRVEPQVILATVNVAVGLGMLGYCLARSSRVDFFSPAWAFPIAYLLLLTLGTLAAAGPIRLTQWVIYEVGIIAYFLGVVGSRIVAPYLGHLGRYEYSLARSKVVLLLFFSVGFLAIAAVYVKIGIPILRSNVNVARYDVSQNAYLATLGNLLSASAILAATLLFQRRQKSPSSTALYSLIVVCGFLFALTTGSRNALLKILLILAVIYHYSRRIIQFKTLLYLGIVAVLFVGGVGLYRNISAYGTGILARFGEGPLGSAALANAVWHFAQIQFSVSSQNFAQLLDVIPEFFDYQYGYLFTAPFILWLPGEQMKAGVVAREAIGGDWLGGASITLVGSFFFDLGFAGVVLGMLFVGFLLGVLHKLARDNGSVVYLALYAFFTYNALVSIRSNFMGGFDVVFFPACFAAFHLLSYAKGSTHDAEPPSPR